MEGACLQGAGGLPLREITEEAEMELLKGSVQGRAPSRWHHSRDRTDEHHVSSTLTQLCSNSLPELGLHKALALPGCTGPMHP